MAMRRGLQDILLAVGLAALAEGEALAGQLTGPRAATIPLGLLMTLPLALRRRLPLVALACVMISFVLQSAAGVKLQDNDLASVLAVLVATYSVAAYSPTGSALLGAVAAYAVLAATALHGLSGLVWALVLVGGAWLASWALRSRRLETVAALEHARTIEEQHEAAVLQASTEERTRIARELHDVVSHAVSVIVVQAGAGEQMLPADADESREALQAIQSTGRQALRELRRLLGVLRTPELAASLGPQPGLGDIGSLVESAVHAGTPVTLDIEGDPTPLPAGLDLAAFRIVQESLTNILKHAPGSPAGVRVVYRPEALELDIVNETPIPSMNGSVGHGLIGIRERARLYGGEAAAGPTDGVFRVSVRLPLEESL